MKSKSLFLFAALLLGGCSILGETTTAVVDPAWEAARRQCFQETASPQDTLSGQQTRFNECMQRRGYGYKP